MSTATGARTRHEQVADLLDQMDCLGREFDRDQRRIEVLFAAPRGRDRDDELDWLIARQDTNRQAARILSRQLRELVA